jgi:hypothetical protein
VGYWYAVVALATRVQAILQRRPPFSRAGDRFDAGGRFVPLLAAVPAAVVVLVVQMATFTTPLLALQAIVGLLVLNAGLARLVVYRQRRAVRPAARLPVGVEPAAGVVP